MPFILYPLLKTSPNKYVYKYTINSFTFIFNIPISGPSFIKFVMICIKIADNNVKINTEILNVLFFKHRVETGKIGIKVAIRVLGLAASTQYLILYIIMEA